ncbi:hypothetical protein SAMN05421810_103411 [Amycolatopsis arida]|uniref:Alkaline shock response membrane anchor protein AmaP n=1 Tax=Amycolatopsis arida TaxID=587909 RepID=A0A1I5T6K5_9PSEU|nr:alkaline shock response membrane anchor protein AmaP [Amycolatopsis arida]TDX96210.1 hypothetical protein CLV69_103347 [Amycolatopsis arida]SFP78672.1 hypothetical protein SAMN05421810_103411 [Amycolatopsis arida]
MNTSSNRPARLNRALLALLGVLLLAAGAFAVATHAGWLRLLDPAAPLVPGTGRPPAWVPYVVAAGAVLLGLLALRWLVAQAVRRPRTETWELRQERGVTRLDPGVVVEPLVEEIESIRGVHDASATLAGGRDAPELHLAVGAERDADLVAIRRRIEEDALPRLRQALDLDGLPAAVEFRLTGSRGPRAV